jgi:hypothetical protein
MSFPNIRIGIEQPKGHDNVIFKPDEMRARIYEASYESHLIRNVMTAADHAGMSAEDRYTMLAYHALVALETYYQQVLKFTMRYPNPLNILKDPTR